MTKLQEIKMWNGQYKGIYFEIKHHGHYCYYIYLKLPNFQDKALQERLWREDDNYYHETFPEFELHGGITYYSRCYSSIYTPETKRIPCKAIVIGCDYDHLWDSENYQPFLDMVMKEVEESVDYIHSNYEYLISCSYDGHLCKHSDLKPKGDGFYCEKHI